MTDQHGVRDPFSGREGSNGRTGRTNSVTWRSVLRAVVRGLVFGTGEFECESAVTETAASEADELPFREMEVVNWPETRTKSLERTLDRAESVLDGQLRYLSDIHDKAVRTVYIEIVLFGVIASGWQLVPNTDPVNVWMKAGGVLIVGSTLAGIFTSSSSSPDYGPGPSYVRSNLESGATNEDVYLELLQGYREAISNNRSLGATVRGISSSRRSCSPQVSSSEVSIPSSFRTI